MRFAWVALLLVTACRIPPEDDPPDDAPNYSWPPMIDPDGGFDVGCRADTDCGGLVCARTGECLLATQVHAVRVTWMVGGNPPSESSCTSLGDLAIEFVSDYESTGFAPVPCDAGIFSIDKYPIWFRVVRLGPASNATGLERVLDATGMVAFDLPYNY